MKPERTFQVYINAATYGGEIEAGKPRQAANRVLGECVQGDRVAVMESGHVVAIYECLAVRLMGMDYLTLFPVVGVL